MDTLWILVPFAILGVFIFLTCLIHHVLWRKVNLVVANISTVSIIGLVVAAILFPVFSRAREHDGRSRCPSNMKQIGLGFIQYVQDYDEKWPEMGLGGHWASQIYSYEKSTGVYKCDEDPTQSTSTTWAISYAANSNLGDGIGGQSDANLSAPAVTVLAADFDNGTRIDMTTFNGGAPSNSNGRGFYGGCNLGAPCDGHPIHDPSIMFLACDGHVKLLRPEKVSPGRDNPSESGEQSPVFAAGTKAVASGDQFRLTYSEK